MFCDDDHNLENGICEFIAAVWNRKCFSVFVKLTPFPNQYVGNPENINSEDFGEVERQNKLRRTLPGLQIKNSTGGEIEQTFIDFVKADTLGNVEYMIVYITSAFMSIYDKDHFLRIITTETTTFFREEGRDYHIGPSLYNISFSNGIATVFVPNVANTSVEELTSPVNATEENMEALTSPFDGIEENMCPNGTSYITKLHKCPYVKLNVNELHVTFDEAHLNVMQSFENDTVLLTLSRFEFERVDEEIYLCFDDYLKISQAWTYDYDGTASISTTHMLYIWHLFCPVFIFFLFSL